MENNTKVVDGRNVKATEEDFLATNAKITQKMFENIKASSDGHRKMSFQDFRAHQKNLKEALWHYEFWQYDADTDDKAKNGKISCSDFARSILIILPYKKQK